MAQAKITPSLWYVKEAEDAATFYTSLFPDSKIDRVYALQSDTPSGPPGSVKVVDFTLFGQPFMAMSAGKLDDFNHAISFTVNCDDQPEVDRYYAALLKDGGAEEQCGWVKDKYGVRWQVTPRVLLDMNASDDKAAAARVTKAMQTMKKLDIATLQAAFAGT